MTGQRPPATAAAIPGPRPETEWQTEIDSRDKDATASSLERKGVVILNVNLVVVGDGLQHGADANHVVVADANYAAESRSPASTQHPPLTST